MKVTNKSSQENELINSNGEPVEVPPDFICPITLQIMEQPLMTKYGINYERSAIIDWLQEGSEVCPMTRRPLKPSNLLPNRTLEKMIEQWKRENHISDSFSSNNPINDLVDSPRFIAILTEKCSKATPQAASAEYTFVLQEQSVVEESSVSTRKRRHFWSRRSRTMERS